MGRGGALGTPMGSPQSWVASAGTLVGGPVFCRRLPITCSLIPLKNWSRSLIGAWRGSSGSGVRFWFTQKTLFHSLPQSHLLFLLSHWPTFWWSGKISPLKSDIHFIAPNEYKQQQDFPPCLYSWKTFDLVQRFFNCLLSTQYKMMEFGFVQHRLNEMMLHQLTIKHVENSI